MAERRTQIVTAGSLFVASVFLLCALAPSEDESKKPRPTEGYSPVAPHEALHAAMRLTLKLVQDWLDNRDFASAAETTEGLVLLARVYECYSDEPAWRNQAKSLREACQNLLARARAKDAPECEKASLACAALLSALAENPPKAATITTAARPAGTLRTIMKLIDGGYADAKGTKSPNERSYWLYTIAEGANLTRSLQNDPHWRQRADDLRDEALRLAASKPQTDLQEVRGELKNVYERCQACHEAYKR